MRDIEARILKTFKENPGESYKTDVIAREVFIDEYGVIQTLEESDDDADKLKAKRLSWKLHRKLLYHLNKLVKENILMVAATVGKNQKIFKLVMDSGELIVRTKRSTVVLHKSVSYSMPTDGYEESGVVVNNDPNTWMSKVNCVLIECSAFNSLEELYPVLRDMLFIVNDAVGLNHFDYLLKDCTVHELVTFVESIIADSSDFDRRINILIEPSVVNNVELLRILIDGVYEDKDSGVYLIQYVNPKQFQNQDVYDRFINVAMRFKGKVYLVNNKKYNTPFIVGYTGIFTLSENAYADYKKLSDKNRVICVAQSSLAIDVKKFREIDGSAKGFEDVLRKCGMSLLEANSISRRRIKENFAFIPSLVQGDYSIFFKYAKNYIRFWNYDIKDSYFDTFVTLLDNTTKSMRNFARQEEIVFQACGIPIRFRLAFASSFMKFNISFKRAYKKSKTINGIKDFQQKEMEEQINNREKLFRFFNGGDRIRFFRSGDVDTSFVKKELAYVLNTVDIPIICYDFADRVENVKLNDFF